jgi:signal transduction histidine kinase
MQGNEIAARRPNGLGVGLAICRSIIKAHGEGRLTETQKDAKLHCQRQYCL